MVRRTSSGKKVKGKEAHQTPCGVHLEPDGDGVKHARRQAESESVAQEALSKRLTVRRRAPFNPLADIERTRGCFN